MPSDRRIYEKGADIDEWRCEWFSKLGGILGEVKSPLSNCEENNKYISQIYDFNIAWNNNKMIIQQKEALARQTTSLN